MRREFRLILIVLALVAGPTAVLSFLAARTLKNWDAVLEKQLATAADHTLLEVAGDLRTEMAAWPAHLAQAVAGVAAGENPEAGLLSFAAELNRTNRWVRQIYVFHRERGLVYPPAFLPPPRPAGLEGGTAALQGEADRLLDEARLLQFQNETQDAAIARYEALLARTDLPDGIRWQAALGLAQSRGRSGQWKPAAAGLLAFLEASRGETGARDAEGYLYSFTARRELLGLQAQAGQVAEAWKTGIDLMERLAARYAEVAPYQRQSLQLTLEETMPKLGPAPGGRDPASEFRWERVQREWRMQENHSRIPALEREAVQNLFRRHGPGTEAEWIVVDGARYVLCRPTAASPWIVGLRLNAGALGAWVERVARQAAGRGLTVAMTRQPSDFRGDPAAAAEFIPPPGRRLAELEMAGGLDGVVLGAWPADPEALRAGSRMQGRLYIWGLFLLAGSVALGIWVAVRQATGEIRRARARSDFVAGVSHDLRTPLASMRMLAESLHLGTISDPATQKRFLAAMVKECDRLGQLTERALYFIRMGQDTLRLHPSEGDLRVLVTDTVAMFGNRFTEGEIELTLKAAEDLPAARFDATALTQVLFNLLENAVKYSPERKDIEVALAQGPGEREAQITVRDHGIGISPRDRRRLFRRYRRGSDPRVAKIGGAGLGLALCRLIVKAHHGRIEVESPPEGGSLFRVILPVDE